MPTKTEDTPTFLRPFVAHGVVFGRVDVSEPCAECPFCGKAKFYVCAGDGRWECKVCGESGNLYTFLNRVWQSSFRSTTEADYASLSQDRGLSVDSLKLYGLAKGFLTGEWLVPGYGTKGSLINLYRWKPVKGGRALMPTPGGDLHHGYFRPVQVHEGYESVEVVEGVWDACARRDSLSHSDIARLLTTLVVGTPGANVWADGWGVLSGGRRVSVCLDNDHPKVNPKSGTVNQPGWSGTRRIALSLLGYSVPPSQLQILRWGENGYDPALPDGYDLRDLNKTHNGTAAGFVDSRLCPVPPEWLEAPARPAKSSPTDPRNTALRAQPCSSWAELLGFWKCAIHHTPDFEAGLLFGLTVAAAVTYGENRLWGRMIGVAGSGKSMICNGISTSTRYVETESTIRGFYSGTVTGDKEDHSFAPRLRDRLWVNNDFDAMRTNPNREEIFAQLRDLYGGKGSKAFHNGIGSRSYHNLRFGVLLAGTPAIYELDSADLGARFLDFVFSKPDAETRRRIGFSAMLRQTGGEADASGMSPELKLATQSTGGYLEHLRGKWDRADPGIRLSEVQMGRIHGLSEFVAFMRGRPPRNQEETTDAVEMPTRLDTQFASVAVYSSLVRGRDRIDMTSMELVRRVALDTAQGRTLEIVRLVAGSGERGVDLRGILGATRKRQESESDLVNYLVEVEVLEECGLPSVVNRVKYRLSPSFREIYHGIFSKEGDG